MSLKELVDFIVRQSMEANKIGVGHRVDADAIGRVIAESIYKSITSKEFLEAVNRYMGEQL